MSYKVWVWSFERLKDFKNISIILWCVYSKSVYFLYIIVWQGCVVCECWLYMDLFRLALPTFTVAAAVRLKWLFVVYFGTMVVVCVNWFSDVVLSHNIWRVLVRQSVAWLVAFLLGRWCVQVLPSQGLATQAPLFVPVEMLKPYNLIGLQICFMLKDLSEVRVLGSALAR